VTSVETVPAAAQLDRDRARGLLRDMIRIRRFEERCAELYSAAKIRGFLHLYIGEEAVAVGALQPLTAEDAVVATYREHGHALVRGVPAGAIMAEMYGKVEGCSRGRGGSMHLFDASRRFYGGNAIVGGGLPLAVGLALADRILGRKRVTACFFGDGAVAEGEFHESINLAALWKLPVLFLCENNLYAMGTRIDRALSQTDLCVKAGGYGVPTLSVDGMDVLAVDEATRQATNAVRAGQGPFFVEFRTYRFRAHSMYDPELYRDKAEVEEWKKRDPIPAFAAVCRTQGLLTEADISRIESDAASEIEAAVAFAEAGTPEPVADLARFVYSEQKAPIPPVTSPTGRTVRTTYREAIRSALREALARDPRVFLMGEDVGRYGGCFAVSKGLLEEFGPEKIRDTPLSESAFVGAGIGAALGGARPIVEIMTVNFSLLALDQIVNNAATIPHMSGGQFRVPLVIRMTTGAGRQLAAQHSHSLEGWYAHVPGLRILAPGTLEDARGMLPTALESSDSVLIFEHGSLYNVEGELDEGAGAVDIERAAVRRPGRDVTLITYGGTLGKTLEAARLLAEEGIEAEVLDLRTLRPLDTAAIVESVSKTRRAVVVDEGWKSGSLSAEVCARIVEGAFYELDAPVARVCTAEVPIPYAKHLEDAALPQPAAIVAAARAVMGKAVV
jgi:pyruvate dehydrogenase E1 component beta subunit/2-oxoisovalerate dehydrogenase E1 component